MSSSTTNEATERSSLTRWAPALALGGIIAMVAYAATQERRRLRSNPSGVPAIWGAVPPGTPYECSSPLKGKTIPGRGGGKVRSCATPSRSRPREGQVYIVPRGAKTGSTMPKSRAAQRLRDQAKSPATTRDLAYLHEAHEAYRATRIPAPSGLEWPHARGSSPCDAEHDLWDGYAEAIEDALERGAIEADDGDYDGAVRRALERHPKFKRWDKAARSCADAHARRVAAKRQKAVSAASERGALVREYNTLGEEAFMERHGAELSEMLDALRETRAPARRKRRK